MKKSALLYVVRPAKINHVGTYISPANNHGADMYTYCIKSGIVLLKIILLQYLDI